MVDRVRSVASHRQVAPVLSQTADVDVEKQNMVAASP